jgi:hypothetical protein
MESKSDNVAEHLKIATEEVKKAAEAILHNTKTGLAEAASDATASISSTAEKVHHKAVEKEQETK